VGNVRFQPLRLMKSACFRKSEIACTTCHSAHRDAARNASDDYNRRCATCHPNESEHTTKLNNNNCVGCHMPKVSPAPGLTFTDHFIRVASIR
jgi:formate-dependent nitrite reductase cytochrome c552 subunit